MMSGDGVLEAYNLCLGFVAGMVAKAVCELGVPDILAAHQEPMTALEITQLLSPQPTRPLHEAAEQLDRLMKCLCSHKVFNSHIDGAVEILPTAAEEQPSSAVRRMPSPVKYSLTPSSNLLLQGDTSLRAFLLLHLSSPFQDPFHHCSQWLLHGTDPFVATQSMDLWAFAAADPPFNRLFNAGMASASNLSVLALLQHYDGFQNGVQTLVDVGGGTGAIACAVAARYPAIRVINFDLPTVIATAQTYPGVQHIGGDMFQSIPSGDAIFMKCMLHDWGDEDCIKILKNCHKVLPRHGKLIIMEAVLDSTSTEGSSFQNIRFAYDMLMVAYTNGGKERTKKQWEVLLGASNFSIHRIIDLPCPQNVIEAIPLAEA